MSHTYTTFRRTFQILLVSLIIGFFFVSSGISCKKCVEFQYGEQILCSHMWFQWGELCQWDSDVKFEYAILMQTLHMRSQWEKSKHSNPLNIWKILVPMHSNMKLQWKCYVSTFFTVELFLAVKWFRSHVSDTRFSLPVNKIITCFSLNHLHVFLKAFRSFARWK